MVESKIKKVNEKGFRPKHKKELVSNHKTKKVVQKKIPSQKSMVDEDKEERLRIQKEFLDNVTSIDEIDVDKLEYQEIDDWYDTEDLKKDIETIKEYEKQVKDGTLVIHPIEDLYKRCNLV